MNAKYDDRPEKRDRRGASLTGTLGRRIVIASPSPVTRSGDRWITKNRVGALADRLAELGWDVTLLAQQSGPMEFLTQPVASSVRVVPLRRWSPVAAVRAFWELRRANAGIAFMPLLRTAAFALVLGRKGIVYWGLAWALIPGSSRYRVWLERLVARRAGRAIVVGEAEREALAAHARALELCVPLVPREVARAMKSSDLIEKPDGPLRVLFVGSVGVRKGVPELLEAVEALPQVEFRLIGSVEDPAVGRRVLQVARERPNLTVEPYADWEELRRAYRAAHVLALPARLEGVPRVIYEATAFGAALVVTPVGGTPHRLTDGEDALFVRPGDAMSLASALRRLTEDREITRTLARGARTRLASYFVDDDPALQFDRALRWIVNGGAPVADPSAARER